MRNLVLVGFMGTGKSEIGRAVAERVGRPFMDTDAIVEARDGRPISLIFEESGEEYFRDLESAAVAEAASQTGVVIATGGGALGRSKNVEALKATGVLVCLTARPEVIIHRVRGQGVDRPLLRCGDPLGRIRSLLAARAEDYAKAHAQVDTSDLTVEEAVEAVLRVWCALEESAEAKARRCRSERNAEAGTGSGGCMS
ncbi:MAG: shikimate kinase [Armatimonadota bacterium]